MLLHSEASTRSHFFLSSVIAHAALVISIKDIKDIRYYKDTPTLTDWSSAPTHAQVDCMADITL